MEDDYAPENLSSAVTTMVIEKVCHGCCQVRQMDSRAAYCTVCYWHQSQGMDLAFRDDNFDDC